MIATIQLILLSITVYKLVKYHGAATKQHHRYRVFISMIATAWTMACVFVMASMLVSWPEVVTSTGMVTALMSGASAGMAIWCGGNVAQLIRNFKSIIRRLI